MSVSEHYLEGVDLFNRGRYWHAHEAWEDAWKVEGDPEIRLFYKGIIQTAAALVHWRRGNPRGLHLNWNKARGKLSQLPPALLGLDLHGLVEHMDRFDAADGDGIAAPTLYVRRET